MFRLILTCLVLAVAVGGGCDRQRDGRSESERDSGEAKGTADEVAVMADASSPASVRVDGQAADWRNIPVLLKIPEDQRDADYQCRAIRMTADEDNLYLLYELGTGIGDRHADQIARTGAAQSGSLGRLHLTGGERTIVVWIITGFRSTYDSATDEIVNTPWVKVEVSRSDGGGTPGSVFQAQWPDDPNHIAFEDKRLELSIPLVTVGLNPQASLDARWESR